MKHVFILETVDERTAVTHSAIARLAEGLEREASAMFGLAVVRHVANVRSATRGVYNLYCLPHDQSPNQLGSLI